MEEQSEESSKGANSLINEITEVRQNVYGHPAKHFFTTRAMFNCWEMRRNDAAMSVDDDKQSSNEHALKHAVYMIIDKLVRAANNPNHKDNWDDIQGYARCAKMVLGLEK